MAKKELRNLGSVNGMTGDDTIMGIFGGIPGQIPVHSFQQQLNNNDTQVLNELAFYIDVNEASAKGSAYVNTGGNMNMRKLWEDSKFSCLMDENGNYCMLNQNDCRYTEDGEYILEADGTLAKEWAHLDMMTVIPVTYGRIQVLPMGDSYTERLWLSLVPLPGGYKIAMLPVGKFKISMVNGVARSVPGVVTADSMNINTFWAKAQARSKSHGLANMNFRNYLLFHMMAKYGQRDSQNCASKDGTPIWGVGLDGSESTGPDKFVCQKMIKTGSTLSLGNADGNVEIPDADGTMVHSINVGGFENVWGLKWEMIQGLCSVGNNVYCWDSNFVPETTPAPTADTFKNVPHVLLTRPTSPAWGMNIVAQGEGQGAYMIPMKTMAGISYGDYYYYAAEGQLWLWGGSSYYGSACGLACSYSLFAWSNSYSNYSARLAFYGGIRRRSTKELKKTIL